MKYIKTEAAKKKKIRCWVKVIFEGNVAAQHIIAQKTPTAYKVGPDVPLTEFF